MAGDGWEKAGAAAAAGRSRELAEDGDKEQAEDFPFFANFMLSEAGQR